MPLIVFFVVLYFLTRQGKFQFFLAVYFVRFRTNSFASSPKLLSCWDYRMDSGASITISSRYNFPEKSHSFLNLILLPCFGPANANDIFIT